LQCVPGIGGSAGLVAVLAQMIIGRGRLDDRRKAEDTELLGARGRPRSSATDSPGASAASINSPGVRNRRGHE
jgi:hypothetical protein